MKYILFTLIIFGALPAFSQTGSLSTSRFHLFTSKCEPEAGDELETTPQSPPLDVDDPATPGCNKLEVNLLVDGDISGIEKSWNVPLIDINYGIGDNVQLKYEVPNVNVQSEGSSTTAIGNSKAGLKFQFYGNEESKLQLAVYPQMEFVKPDLQTDPGGPISTVTTLPILLAKKIGEVKKGDVNLTTNVAYNISSKSDTSDFIFSSVGVGMPLLRKLAILSELSTIQAVSKTPDGVREQLFKLAVGLIGPVNKQFSLFGSVGESLYSSDQRQHTYVLAGIRLLAGGKGL